MQLHLHIRVVNGVHHSEVGLATYPGSEPLTPCEREALSRFGEPVVDCGGDFTEFQLPTNSLRFPSQFPVKAVFAEEDYPEGAANAHAVTFRDVIESRLIAARNALLERVPGTLGTDIKTV